MDPRSRVKHSNTESLRSFKKRLIWVQQDKDLNIQLCPFLSGQCNIFDKYRTTVSYQIETNARSWPDKVCIHNY